MQPGLSMNICSTLSHAHSHYVYTHVSIPSLTISLARIYERVAHEQRCDGRVSLALFVVRACVRMRHECRLLLQVSSIEE
jgi:hypothetical protein